MNCARPTCGHPEEDHVVDEIPIVDDEGPDLLFERTDCLKCNCPHFLTEP